MYSKGNEYLRTPELLLFLIFHATHLNICCNVPLQFSWIFVVWNNHGVKIESLFPIFWYLSSPHEQQVSFSELTHLFSNWLILVEAVSAVHSLKSYPVQSSGVGALGTRETVSSYTWAFTDSNIPSQRSLLLSFARALKSRFCFCTGEETES